MTRALTMAAVITCLALVCATGGVCQTPEARIAFVVDASGAMQEPWLATTRLKATLAAVTTELKSLPLRAKAGVWLARSGGPELLIEPSLADALNNVRLDAQGKGPEPELSPSIAPAIRWVADGTPGAVIIVGLPMGGALAETTSGGPFVHGLLTGPLGSDTGMQAPLILQSGGRLATVDDPKRLQAALHELVRLGLSRASLLADVRNADNERLDIRLQIAMGNSKQPARTVLSNTPAQVLSGTYNLVWPKDPAIGPGEPPPLARVPKDAQTIVRAGGKGKLVIMAHDATGKDQAWKFSISSLPGGAVVVTNAHTPFEQDLPAGRLLIAVVKPASSWTVDLPAGAKRTVMLGPRGKLTIELEGPGGPVRLPVTAIGPGTSDRQWRGYTNSPISLPPGDYTVDIGTMPSTSRQVTLNPGSSQSIEMPFLGGVLIRSSNITTPQRYDVINVNDEIVGKGHTGRMLPLLPGRYAVVLPGGKRLAAEISPGHVTALDAN